jgi:hypothetical protein
MARRAAEPPQPKAAHLAASLQVVRAHQRRRHVSIEDARRAVLEAAERIASGVAGPESEALAAKLEKVTGIPIAELAKHAEHWPTP